MAAPQYNTDLITVATADEANGWVELSGTDEDGFAYNAQSSPAYVNSSNPFIQGSFAVTQVTPFSNAMASLAFDSGGITIPTDGAIFLWQNFSSPAAMGTYAEGGYRIAVGSEINAFKVYSVGGSEKDNNPYGGFVNHVVNPTVSQDKTVGSPSSVINYIGSAVFVVTGVAAGSSHQCDIIRYGRGVSRFELGDSAGFATIEGFATKNDLLANRWGLVQKLFGGYLFKGKMQLGSIANPVNFRDSDRIILVQWTPKVTTSFNTVELLNATSVVSMTRFTFITLDPSGTASRGKWENTANATLTLDSCVFADMDTFSFGSLTTITGTAFNRCNRVTQANATITGSTFNRSTDSVSLVSNNITKVYKCTFTSDGSNHAVEATTPGNYDWNNTAVGYATVNGTTGNEIFYNNSGGHIDLTIQGGTAVTVRNGSGATTVLKEGNPAVIDLKSAASFGLLALGAITGAGTVEGDIGQQVGGIAPTITSTGTTYPPADPIVLAAIADFDAAFTEAKDRPFSTLLSAAAFDLGGLTLKRGTYRVGAAATLTSAVTLDAENDPNAVFIIQIGGAFGATAATGNVILINGALARNVFWQVNDAFTRGANTIFKGTLLGGSTATFGATTAVEGRILAAKTGSTITLATTTVTDPAPGVELTVEIRDADGGLITDPCEVTIVTDSTTSTVFHDENVTTGSTKYSYSANIGSVVYVNVLNTTGYEAKTINNFVLSTTDSVLAVQLDQDRAYVNPL